MCGGTHTPTGREEYVLDTPRLRRFIEAVNVIRHATSDGPAAIAAIRPDAIMKDVDAAARTVIEAAGHAQHFNHSLGHGIGLQVHEAPRVAKRSTDKLADGMVFSVEPGIYLAEWGGVRIEDLVVLENGRCRVLTASPKVYVAT